MGTVRKRTGNRYQAVIRRLGYPPVSRSFNTKTEATRFARLVESQMDAGTYLKGILKDHTVASVIGAYIAVVVSIKPIGRSALAAMRKMSSALGSVRIEDLTIEMLMGYAQERATKVKPSTISKQFYIFAKVVDRVCLINNIVLSPNPIRQVIPLLSELGLIGSSDKRDRLPSSDELRRIRATEDWIVPWVELGLLTAMRSGEMFKLRWDHVDFEENTIQVGDNANRTKNGEWRVIPMFKHTRLLLMDLQKLNGNYPKVFMHPKTVATVSDRFALICKRLGIEDLHMHDMRHAAITGFIKRGMSIPETALISGHSDWTQLKTYTNLRASDLLEKYN